MAQSVAGKIRIDLLANAGQFSKDMKRAAKDGVGGFRDEFGSGIKALSAFAPAIAGGLTAFKAVTWFRDTAEDMRQLEIQAKDLGIGAEVIQRYKNIGEQTGTSFSDVSTAMKRLNIRIGEAALGSKEAIAGFHNLGVDFRTLMGIPLDKQFERVAAALQKIKDPGMREAISKENLGRGAMAVDTFLPEVASGATGGAPVLSNRQASAWASVGKGIWSATKWVGVGAAKLGGEGLSAIGLGEGELTAEQARKRSEEMSRATLDRAKSESSVLQRQREENDALEKQKRIQADLIAKAEERKNISKATSEHFRDIGNQQAETGHQGAAGDAYYRKEMERIHKMRYGEYELGKGMYSGDPARKARGELTVPEMEAIAGKERTRLNAQESAQKFQEEFNRETEAAARMVEEVESPEERLTRREGEIIQRFNRQGQAGGIDRETAARQLAKAKRDMQSERGFREPTLTASMQSGSREAYSAIVQSLMSDPKTQLQREANAKLDAIEKAIRERPGQELEVLE